MKYEHTHTYIYRELKSLKFRNKAFTLIELLIVIAIIGLLSSVVLASLNSARWKARDARRNSDINQIQLAFEMYYDSVGNYPSSEGTWKCLGHTSVQPCWIGSFYGSDSLNLALQSYMSKIPDDSQNNTACYGDAYLYNSNISGISGRPSGAYLHWDVENGIRNDSACGKGFYGGIHSDNCQKTYCWLYIGS